MAGAEAEMYRCEILNKGRAGTLAFACKKGAKRTISELELDGISSGTTPTGSMLVLHFSGPAPL